MRLTVKIAMIIACLFFVFTITGFFVLPPLAKSFLTKTLSEQLHREVSIKEIKINPYSLTVAVRGVVIKDRETKDVFVSFAELFVNIQALSLLKGAFVVKEVGIAKPYLNIVRKGDASYNFSDLIEAQPPAQARKKKARPLFFSINNIILSDGSIDFFDGPKNTRHTMREMKVTVPFISNMQAYVDKYVQPKFSAYVNDDFYSIQGETKPFADSLETSLDISIKDLDFPRYIPYLPVKLNLVLQSGAMDMDVKVTFVQSKEKAPSLTVAGNVSIRKLVADDLKRNSLIRIPSAEIAIKSIEPFKNIVGLSRVSFQAPELTVRREQDGTLNLNTLVPGETGGSAKLEDANKTGTAREQGQPPSITIDNFELTGGKVSFHDLALSEPVSIMLTNIGLKGEHISTAKASPFPCSLSFLLDRRGAMSAKGSMAIDPLSVDLSVNLKGIGLRLFQPYIPAQIRAHIAGGEITTSGKFLVSRLEDRGVDTSFSGNILVSNFSAIDRVNGDDFLRWKALAFNIKKFGHNPLQASIDNISLSDFFARIIVNPDGTLNLQQVFGGNENKKEAQVPAKAAGEKKTSPADKNEPQAGPPKDITIGTITVQGGTIDFSDRFVKPNYSARLSELGGRVSGMSLGRDRRAEVEVRGKLNENIPLEIVGKINPSRENFFVDLAARFNDLDVSPMTPYSGKYMGYKIEKGKLSIDLKYLIDKRKLDSQNRIFIDQLTLGERVESPDATKLPVRLAIALLKDRAGQIKLDVPVSGSLDDPKFSVWKIVLQVIVNLLAKAAVAPFALIGALFGGGEELSYLEFDYGLSAVSDVNNKKIENLVKALFERPSLRLDVEGHVDIEKDREGLKQYLYNKKIKMQKLKDITRRSKRAVSVDDIRIEPEEFERYLTMAYNAEKFPKPRNVLGLAKTLPAEEMTKLMLTHTIISDDDLRTLAIQRANSVKDSILKSGKVTADRVFIVEPKALSPEKKERLRDSRVDFKLK